MNWNWFLKCFTRILTRFRIENKMWIQQLTIAENMQCMELQNLIFFLLSLFFFNFIHKYFIKITFVVFIITLCIYIVANTFFSYKEWYEFFLVWRLLMILCMIRNYINNYIKSIAPVEVLLERYPFPILDCSILVHLGNMFLELHVYYEPSWKMLSKIYLQ